MKYSKQQVNDLNRYYNDLQTRIKLINQRNKGIQSVLIDKEIPIDLLDRRNTNDIENDKFARRDLLNDYTNKLITSGTAY